VQQCFDERNRNLIVNVAGRLVHRDEAGVSPLDSAVQGGDAVWEGLRLYSGRIFRLEQHLDRLVESAKALAFDTIPPRAEIIGQIRRTLEANAMADGVHIRSERGSSHVRSSFEFGPEGAVRRVWIE